MKKTKEKIVKNDEISESVDFKPVECIDSKDIISEEATKNVESTENFVYIKNKNSVKTEFIPNACAEDVLESVLIPNACTEDVLESVLTYNCKDIVIDKFYQDPDGYVMSLFKDKCDLCGNTDYMLIEACHIKGNANRYQFICDECLKYFNYRRIRIKNRDGNYKWVIKQ